MIQILLLHLNDEVVQEALDQLIFPLVNVERLRVFKFDALGQVAG